MTEDMQGPPEGVDSSTFEPTDAPGIVLQNLRNLPLFELFTAEEFRAVTTLLRIQIVQRGMLLFEQGGVNHSLYIVRRGRALRRVIGADDVERRTGMITTGAIVNQVSFLKGERSAETIEALDDLTVWSISRDEFTKLLEEYPDLRRRVVVPSSSSSSDGSGVPGQPDASGEQRVSPTRKEYSWQRANEHVVLFRKKHVIVFINSLWPGAAGVLLITALLVIALKLLPPLAVVVQPALGWLILFIMIVLFVFVIWQWVDWQNDYYAITDQRVLHRERVVMIRDEQDEVTLSRIQDIKTDRENFFASLVDIGNVTIEASGSHARVRFENVGNPDEVAKVLFEQLSRSRLESHAIQRARIRLDLRRELGLAPQLPPQQPKPPQTPKRPQFDFRKRLTIFGQQAGMVRNAFMPRLRLEVGDTITYRKHWLQLLETIAFPALALVFYIGLLIGISQFSAELTKIVFSPSIDLVWFVVGVGILFWLVYQFEDWRNDIYILKPDRIIDITASPFGLRGTSRREAKMGAIQNVTSKTRGVLDNVFNVGDVIIQTAGSDGQLVFERIYNPRRVQRDIADRMDAYEVQTREKEAAQRRREMAEWLGIYDELTRLHEKDRDELL